MKIYRWLFTGLIGLIGYGVSVSATAATDTVSQVELSVTQTKPATNGISEVLVAMGFPNKFKVMTHAELRRAIAEDGTDLLPPADQRQLVGQYGGTEVLGKWDDRKMGTFIWVPLRAFDPTRVRALREIEVAFTCLAGDWKEVDLGVKNFAAGQRGTQHGALIQAIEPWTLGNGTQILKLFLDVPMGASRDFVLTDPAGKPIDAPQMQQGAQPGGSQTIFLLKAGKFPASGSIKGTILQFKPVEVTAKLPNLSLVPPPE